MTIHKAFSLLMLAALLLALAGCGHGPGIARDDYYPHNIYPQVSMIHGLRTVLLVDKPVVTSSPDRPMQVTVQVRTETMWRQNVQYRFTFYDKDNRPLEPRMEWRAMQLERHLSEYCQGAAIDTAAVDWRLELRSTDPIPPLL